MKAVIPLLAVFMNPIIDFIRSIPDVIWSGLIASVLTLSGMLISNRSNTKRLLLQLRHDAAEKAKERTATLRHEVYLRMAEELTKANNHLVSLSQSDLTKTNVADGLEGFFVAASKLQLVAEPKTALLVNQLVAEYGELLLRLIARLMPLQKARIDIAISDDLYNKARTEVTRVLDEMAKFNEAVQANDAVYDALQRACDAYQGQAKKYATERSAFWKDFNRLNVEFGRQLLTEMRVVGELQIPVLVEIRRDLGLTAELGAFREQMEAQWNKIAPQLDAMLSAIQDSSFLGETDRGTTCSLQFRAEK